MPEGSLWSFGRDWRAKWGRFSAKAKGRVPNLRRLKRRAGLVTKGIKPRRSLSSDTLLVPQRLKEDRDFLHAAHTALTAQLAERQKAHTDLKASADAAASICRRETSALKDQVADLTAKLTQTIAQTSNKDARWSADRANLEARAKAAEEQARKSTEAAKAGIAERGQLAAKVEQLQRELRDERAKSGRGDEADIIARQLKGELERFIAFCLVSNASPRFSRTTTLHRFSETASHGPGRRKQCHPLAPRERRSSQIPSRISSTGPGPDLGNSPAKRRLGTRGGAAQGGKDAVGRVFAATRTWNAGPGR